MMTVRRAKHNKKLLAWFDRHQRDLPWRTEKTPYRIWISEIMLQQTQVATVIDYFNRFLKTFPDVKSLAAADEAEVLRLWEGLGYYRRARQLHAAAKLIVEKHNGQFPMSFDDVLALPGVGRYTAGAILSISLDQRWPILEGNTIRLFARLLAMKADPRTGSNQKRLWEFSESLLPRKRVGDFNQALMELGSEICTPRIPACDRCPLMNDCPTFHAGLQNKIPAAGKKTVYEDLHEAVVLVRRRGKFLVRRCGEGERWAGLWDFPRFPVSKQNEKTIEGQLQVQLENQYSLLATIQPTEFKLKHAVTRFRITLDCYVAEKINGRLKSKASECGWRSLAEIQKLAMSVTGRKVAERLTGIGEWEF